MSKIRILPEQLANQIAAGEVVERPASVVKELLENSLDAHATRVEIEIEGGGTSLIRIIDNGEGMDEDDVLLSLERHGTSKISSDDDLIAISTLGFRGEAIPSIGSVSKMVITSRRANSELGTRAEIHYGKLIKVHEAGCSTGTVFEIKRLFGNTPARKKFLRTVRTELNHIDEVIKNYALARPDITFSLTVNGKRSLYLENSRSLQERLATIMNYNGRYIPIGDETAKTPERRIYGFLVPPEKLHIGPSRLKLFVNGRAVKDRMISHGVAEGLRSFLMKGKNPSGLIHLVIPPSEVDVNVHPAKHEVRFRNSREIHFLITQAVAAAMKNEQTKLQTSIFGTPQQHSATTIPLEREQPPENPFAPATKQISPVVERIDNQVSEKKLTNGFSNVTTVALSASPIETSIQQSKRSVPLEPQTPTFPPDKSEPVTFDSPPLTTFEPEATPPQQSQPDEPWSQQLTKQQPPQPVSLLPRESTGHGLQIIGQFADLYIFCRNSEGLLVIDQHAAHERLLFEEFRHQYLSGDVVRQNLLFPETVELTLFQSQLIEKHAEELDQMGFTLRDFGGNSFILSAVPALAGKMNPADLLIDVLEQFGSENNRRDTGDKIDTILSTMACKAAVKSGTMLGHQEIDALLNRMARANLFSHCPHGRPVVKQFGPNDIKKWFHRT